MKAIHTLPSSCSNLVVHPMGTILRANNGSETTLVGCCGTVALFVMGTPSIFCKSRGPQEDHPALLWLRRGEIVIAAYNAISCKILLEGISSQRKDTL
jgi:hypothetical protein